ncbi:MAG: hypothetical protein QOE48_6088 [Mycobacterium sp.]|nr:hypothetical protein [Mycobacterium sp.]
MRRYTTGPAFISTTSSAMTAVSVRPAGAADQSDAPLL